MLSNHIHLVFSPIKQLDHAFIRTAMHGRCVMLRAAQVTVEGLMGTAATIHDVAAAAGVSLSTASRAINRSGRVSQDTIDKVQQAVDRLGYQPNALARGMRNNKSNVVGLILSDIANPLYVEIIRGLELALRKHGYALLLGSSENQRSQELELLRFFRSKGANVCILGPCESDDFTYVNDLRSTVPIIFFDRPHPPDAAAISIAHGEGARRATQQLLEAGRTRIAVVMSASQLQPTNERIHGVQQAHSDYGMHWDERLLIRFKTTMSFDAREVMALMQSPLRPDAFLCLGTRMLSGVIGVMHDLQLHLPANISLVSIGDTDFSRFYNPAISAIAWNPSEVVEHFTRAILDLPTVASPQLVCCEFLERESS